MLVFGVVDPFTKTPQYGFSFSMVHGDDACSCDRDTSLDYVHNAICLVVTVHILPPSYRNSDRISEFALGNTVTVLFHVFDCDNGLTDQLHLKPCLSVRCVQINKDRIAFTTKAERMEYLSLR